MRIDAIKPSEAVLITKDDPRFPEMLLNLEKGCPEQLYCIGNVELLNTKSVAIVGSRKTTQYGRNTAREMAHKLASRGITVVSGMAMGIDTCAHEGALNAKGKTIAVLGCGPDVCYPPSNLQLKQMIEETGLVVSEYPPGTPVERFYFPQRNRIISGLCESTIVVQAGVRSGSMITAECAMDQHRKVFAVPGNIDSQYNLGSNKLIKEGITPVVTIGDLLDDLEIPSITEEESREILSDMERKVFTMLWERGEMSVDSLCLALDETPAVVTKILTIMELKGIVFDELGKFFVAKK